MLISKNLKNLRFKKGLTQEELAKRIGVTGQAVSKWERGECYPDITLIPGLAKLFGVTADELLGMEEIGDKKYNFHAAVSALRSEGNYKEAYSLTEKTVREFPGDRGLLASMAGTLALDGGETEKVIQLYEQALDDTANMSDKARV
ncbi:MAG: helix-turn-helix domain-containing protein, partial [Oscillospiraceae bacterium]|nr:helix-turn-helix domain-containing protein [Oscillospiraceae bacterium]